MVVFHAHAIDVRLFTRKCIRVLTNFVSLHAYNQPAHVAFAKTAALVALLRNMDTESVSEWPRRRTKLVRTDAKLVRADACQTCTYRCRGRQRLVSLDWCLRRLLLASGGNFSRIDRFDVWWGGHMGNVLSALTWLGLGGDPAACCLRVEQFTAL